MIKITKKAWTVVILALVLIGAFAPIKTKAAEYSNIVEAKQDYFKEENCKIKVSRRKLIAVKSTDKAKGVSKNSILSLYEIKTIRINSAESDVSGNFKKAFSFIITQCPQGVNNDICGDLDSFEVSLEILNNQERTVAVLVSDSSSNFGAGCSAFNNGNASWTFAHDCEFENISKKTFGGIVFFANKDNAFNNKFEYQMDIHTFISDCANKTLIKVKNASGSEEKTLSGRIAN